MAREMMASVGASVTARFNVSTGAPLGRYRTLARRSFKSSTASSARLSAVTTMSTPCLMLCTSRWIDAGFSVRIAAGFCRFRWGARGPARGLAGRGIVAIDGASRRRADLAVQDVALDKLRRTLARLAETAAARCGNAKEIPFVERILRDGRPKAPLDCRAGIDGVGTERARRTAGDALRSESLPRTVR